MPHANMRMGDDGILRVSFLGTRRYLRVLGQFILKATRRDNIRFFAPRQGDLDLEQEAIAWLQPNNQDRR